MSLTFLSHLIQRMHVYIIIENGDSYDVAYNTYGLAVNAVKAKHRKELQSQGYPEESCSEVDIPESKSGRTYLYIEKGIHIYIHKLFVLI